MAGTVLMMTVLVACTRIEQPSELTGGAYGLEQ